MEHIEDFQQILIFWSSTLKLTVQCWVVIGGSESIETTIIQLSSLTVTSKSPLANKAIQVDWLVTQY